ncbi:DegT/DnrJ/EryC1/StrS family aminotransferase [Litoribrevibacter euphylliae]|uniref:DegT/DnrJ/EryC1/StrS family aminotransferase n=1 Tax=Litoribrevibacter euphylliae TaxID=1834034 RepID=A0ABV7HCB4_9GAMM
MINVFEPSVGIEDSNRVSDVLESKWIGAGPHVKAFREELSVEFGVEKDRVLLTNSCSAGLMVLPYLFDLKAGDSVIMPTISFPSLANSFKRLDITIKFCDVDKRTGNVTLDCFRDLVDATTKAIIVTHYGGTPVELEEIKVFASSRNIYVIEDTACAIKSFDSQGRRVGTYSDCAIWSFDAMKTLTCGDGGMMILRDQALRDKASELLYLGLPASDKSGLDKSGSGDSMWWEYDILRPGSRDIMNDILAAIGREQLSKLDQYIERRKKIATFYCEELGSIKEVKVLSQELNDSDVSHYFFTIETAKRNELARFLKDNNVYTTFRYWPLHKTTLYKDVDSKFPNAEYMAANCLNLPIHQNLSDANISLVVQLIKSFFEE